jgi:hypothetical protein
VSGAGAAIISAPGSAGFGTDLFVGGAGAGV